MDDIREMGCHARDSAAYSITLCIDCPTARPAIDFEIYISDYGAGWLRLEDLSAIIRMTIKWDLSGQPKACCWLELEHHPCIVSEGTF